MLFTIIILFCSVVLLGSVYATFCASAKPNGPVLIGVTLSYTGLHDSRTKEAVRMYKQSGRRLILLCILLHIPLCLTLGWYTSVFIACYTLWCVILFAGANAVYQRSFRELYRLKSQNHWFTGNSLRFTAENRILGDDAPADFTDDDFYWLKGYYYNPDSKKLMAPPRPNSFQSNIGMNMALPAARAITYTLYALFAGLMLFLIISFVRMDFAPYNLYVENENVVITAPFYGIEFAADDIESMKLCDGLPGGHFSRTNGAETNQYLLGNFRQSGSANYKMFYYIGYSPVIQLELSGYTVIFNTKDSDLTMDIYNDLKKEL